jgi:hypothetical protein
VTVERDENGRIKKGQSLNPSGLDRKRLLMVRQLEGLTSKAIGTLGRLLDSDQGAVALGAANSILNRNLGTPKAIIDLTIETSISAQHMAALQLLADKARAQSGLIDITPLSVVNDEPTLDLITESTHVLSTERSTD